MIRLWLLPQGEEGRESRILTGSQLAAHDVHPLRCVYLGRWPAADDAGATAAAKRNLKPPELVIARNVRVACDRGQTKRWRLSEQEMDLLRRGRSLTIRDGLGEFGVCYQAFDG